MATTTNLGITKPTVGASLDSWGTEINAGTDAIDAVFKADGTGTSVGLNVGSGKTLAVAGTASISGAFALSGDQVQVSEGGTAATTAAGARTNLGLVIGTDVQAYNASLTTVATNGLGTSANQVVQRDASARIPIGSTWTVYESAGVLYFAVSGVAKAKLDGSGNLTVAGDVTAFGTV